MFRAGHSFKLPDDFIEKHDLEFAFAKFEHIETLLKFQNSTLFKLSPRLTEDCLNPGHFKVYDISIRNRK